MLFSAYDSLSDLSWGSYARCCVAECLLLVAEEKLKYPTSNKKPAKDWDKMEAEVKKEVCQDVNALILPFLVA